MKKYILAMLAIFTFCGEYITCAPIKNETKGQVTTNSPKKTKKFEIFPTKTKGSELLSPALIAELEMLDEYPIPPHIQNIAKSMAKLLSSDRSNWGQNAQATVYFSAFWPNPDCVVNVSKVQKTNKGERKPDNDLCNSYSLPMIIYLADSFLSNDAFFLALHGGILFSIYKHLAYMFKEANESRKLLQKRTSPKEQESQTYVDRYDVSELARILKCIGKAFLERSMQLGNKQAGQFIELAATKRNATEREEQRIRIFSDLFAAKKEPKAHANALAEDTNNIIRLLSRRGKEAKENWNKRCRLNNQAQH
ncbi:MAG: hypothetical protein LBJ89_04625 [Holosporales bacterium]|jgi:hypothetical protein|nr:hypothetical protein [Holosporales bacterium]